MSIFGKIKDAIFGHKDKPAATPQQRAPHAAPKTTTARPATAAPAATPVQAQLTQADVERMLESKPGSDKLNWRSSIVDLMKLVGIDPSLENRKELAQELGYTGERNGSAEMNMWLHDKVMQELAAHDGQVSADLR